MGISMQSEADEVYYSLAPKYKLRGWNGFPYALVYDADVIRLNREEFNVIIFCDGKTDIKKMQSQKVLRKISRFEEKGYVCASNGSGEIDRDQLYYHFDNRYFQNLYWSITGRCNFSCRHCYLSSSDVVPCELSHEEAIDIIDQIADCGVYHLLLSGGEPFVRSDFWALVDHALERGIRIDQVYTNGWLLTEKMLDEFDRRDMKPEFSISFDGVGWHDWMRGVKGAEQAALDALRRCQSRKFPTNVEMCIHRGNKDTIRENVRVLAETGTGSIKFSEVSNTPRWKKNAAGNDMPTREYVEAVLQYIPDFYADGMPVQILFSGVVWLYKDSTEYQLVAEFDEGMESCLKRHICGALRSTCYIAPDGRLLPCMPIASVPDLSIFPKLQDIGLQAALKDSFLMEFADRRVSDLLKVCKSCRECPYHLRCGGGCRASAVMEGEHSLMGPDPFRCLMWKEGYVKKVHDVCDAAIEKYCRKSS